MFKRVEEFLKKKKEEAKKLDELKRAQGYYRLVKAGQVFIQFVQQDMKKNGDQVNRHMRRRMEHDLNKKGVLSEELVQYYGQKIDWLLGNIEQRLTPPKTQTTPQNIVGEPPRAK
jgi:hypothetical protein